MLTLIDISTIIESPVDSSNGSALPYPLRDELDRARKGEGGSSSPGDSGSGRGSRLILWEKIIRIGQDWLTHQSKELGVAARMAEALTKVHGSAGLRDGMILLRRLVEECWDRLIPPIDGEAGLESRLAPLHWLDDTDRGALFPGTVRLIPVINDATKSYSWVDWRKLQSRADDADWKEFERVSHATPLSVCQTNVAQFVEAGAELDRLVEAVMSRSGRFDFDMPGLKQAIRDCEELARMVVDHHPDHLAPEASIDPPTRLDREQGGDLADSDPSENRLDPDRVTRERIYQQIDQLAKQLQEIEPHSPVPYLLRRAVELGSMPFPKLMKELVRDPGSLGRVFQELGISDVS